MGGTWDLVNSGEYSGRFQNTPHIFRYRTDYIRGICELRIDRLQFPRRFLRQFSGQHPFQDASGGGAGAFDVDADQGAFAEVDHGMRGAEQMGDGR
jgi:hypothetical protein